MPLLKIQTNREIDNSELTPILKKASTLVADQLGKPESFIMLTGEANTPMLFAGTDEPCAYLELKSLNLPQDKTTQLSGALCQFIEAELGIAQNRIYIEFADGERHLWGWDGRTF